MLNTTMEKIENGKCVVDEGNEQYETNDDSFVMEYEEQVDSRSIDFDRNFSENGMNFSDDEYVRHKDDLR
jgi:hypothetical protein